MLSAVFGFFWITFGLLWLWKPHWLKTRMGKKTARKIKWPLYIFVLFFAANLLGVIFSFKGLLIKMAGIIGIFITVKILLGLSTKATGNFLAWWADLPLFVFRAIACLSVITGIMLMRA